MNTVNIIGNLTKDPEVRYLSSGESVTEFRIAVNQYKKGEQVACFWDVNAWGKGGEKCAEILKKGHKVGLTARLAQDRWQDNEGKDREKTYLVAAPGGVMFLTPKDTNLEDWHKPEPTGDFQPVTADDIPF